MRHRKAFKETFGALKTKETEVDSDNHNHAHSLNAKQLAEVITGNKKSIFFQFGESLIDIRSEKHLIACFETNSEWKKNPMNHIYSFQLFFALNLKWKFYVLCALFVKELITGILVLASHNFHLLFVISPLIKLFVITIACKFFLNTMRQYHELKRIKVMNQQDSPEQTVISNMNGTIDFDATQLAKRKLESSKLQKMFEDTEKQQLIPIETELPFVTASRLLNLLCLILLLTDALTLWVEYVTFQETYQENGESIDDHHHNHSHAHEDITDNENHQQEHFQHELSAFFV